MPPKAANQPLRPAQRYRPGKAPVPLADSDSDDDDDQQQQQELEQAGDEDHDAGEDVALHAPRAHAGPGKLNVALREVEVDTGGKVRVGGRDEVGRTQEESSEGEYGASCLRVLLRARSPQRWCSSPDAPLVTSTPRLLTA